MTTETDELIDTRESNYGKLEDGATLMQALKQTARQHPNWDKLPDYQKEVIEMIFHKLGRQINGNYKYEDNFLDIAGYAKKAFNILQAENLKEKNQLPEQTKE
jgi:hypothetical protein